jgi:recombination DNA repair RAD52 pathway protein
MTTQTTAANSQSIMGALYAQFPAEMERTMTVSGVELKFIPVSEVINRLNKVLGIDAWSFEVLKLERDPIETDEIISHVSLTAKIGDSTITKHGVGGVSIKRIKSTGRPVDLGNSYKMAVSDALKKAAQQLGVGLYLSRTADALDAEEALSVETINSGNQNLDPVVDTGNKSELETRYEAFIDIAKKLSKEQREELNEFWKNYSGGKPKPTKALATLEDLQALNAEAIRLMFGGRYVEQQQDAKQ